MLTLLTILHTLSVLMITLSYQQNMLVFAVGCKNMNDILNYHVCSASHMRPGLHFSICPARALIMLCAGSQLLQIMALDLLGTKPLPEPLLTYCKLHPYKQTLVKFQLKDTFFFWKQSIRNCHLQNVGHFVLTSICLYDISSRWWWICLDMFINQNIWLVQCTQR